MEVAASSPRDLPRPSAPAAESDLNVKPREGDQAESSNKPVSSEETEKGNIKNEMKAAESAAFQQQVQKPVSAQGERQS